MPMFIAKYRKSSNMNSGVRQDANFDVRMVRAPDAAAARTRAAAELGVRESEVEVERFDQYPAE